MHTIETRKNVVAYFCDGNSALQTAKHFGVSQVFVKKCLVVAGIQPRGHGDTVHMTYEKKHAANRAKGVKECPGCSEVKPLSDFGAQSASPDGVHPRCKKCVNKYHRESLDANPEAKKKANAKCRDWHAAHLEISRARAKAHYHNNKDMHRDTRLRKKYGITLVEYDALLVSQGGVCAICKRSTPTRGNGRFQVDHDHETCAVRGLLCSTCNTVLGFLEDRPERLHAAIDYLANPPAQTIAPQS